MILLHAVALVLSAAHRGPVLGPGCATDDGLTTAFEDVVKDGIKMRPSPAWRPTTLALADTGSVHTIHDDSLCDRAVLTIRSWVLDSIYWPPRIRLVQAGKYFVAQVMPRPGGTGEFLQMYVMDRAMTRLYYPCELGIACKKP